MLTTHDLGIQCSMNGFTGILHSCGAWKLVLDSFCTHSQTSLAECYMFSRIFFYNTSVDLR